MKIPSNLSVFGSIKGYDNSNSVTGLTTFEDEVPLSIRGGAYIGNGLKVEGGIFGDINGDINGKIVGDINGNINGSIVGNIASATHVDNVTAVAKVSAGKGKTAIEGDIIGNIEGNVKGNINGNITGSVGSVIGTVSAVGNSNFSIAPTYSSTTGIINFAGAKVEDENNPITKIVFGLANKEKITNYYFGSADTSNTVALTAGSVYGAVWNDLADCIDVDFTPKSGYCYCYKDGKYFAGNEGLILGINSDTYGFALNKKENNNQLTIGVAGFVLAFIDKEYKPGTPLKPNERGVLTKAHFWETNKIVGRYYRKETSPYWGPAKAAVEVKGRHWIKID